MTHFVYPYIKTENDYDLKKSLRSIYKNYIGNFDITIIGEIPNWINTRKIVSIKFMNNLVPRVQNATLEKMILANSLYDSFVRMDDDQFFIKKTSLNDLKKIRFLEYYGYDESLRNQRVQGNNYIQALKRTYFELKDSGIDESKIKNFANHAPYYFEKNKFNKIVKMFDLKNEIDSNKFALIFENLYYNIFNNNDSILLNNFRAGFYGDRHNDITNETHILNYNDIGYKKYNKKIERELNMFNDKCDAEL